MTIPGAVYSAPAAHRPRDIHIDTSLAPSVTIGATVPVAAYASQEFTSYSAASNVSSFNYPATTDSSLLTPVSSAGSPSTQQKSALRKPPLYQSSQAPNIQQPSPPTTAASRWLSPFDSNPSSQTSSPVILSVPATEAPFPMANYVQVTQSPLSREEAIPPPSDRYTGSFGVSSTSPGDDMPQFAGYASYMPTSQDANAAFLSGNGHHPMIMQPSDYPSPTINPEDLGSHASVYQPPYPVSQPVARGQPPSHPVAERSPRNSSGRKPKPGRVRKPSRPAGARQPIREPETTPARPLPESDQLRLSEDCPQEDRDIFQLRMDYDGEKGQMWNELSQKYAEMHGAQKIATLQMKVSRAVARYGIWPQREEGLLMEAFHHDENTRYERIKRSLKDAGGCRCWDWSAAHIETKLVEMGLEDLKVDEITQHRKRRRGPAQHKSLGYAMGPNLPAGLQTNGLGASMMSYLPPDPRQNPYAGLISPGAPLTSEQREKLIDGVFTKPEGDSPMSLDGLPRYDTDMMSSESHVGSTASNEEFHHSKSEQVARQACEQILLQESRYPSLPTPR